MPPDRHLWRELTVRGSKRSDDEESRRSLVFLDVVTLQLDLCAEQSLDSGVVDELLLRHVFRNPELGSDRSPVRNYEGDIVRPIRATDNRLAYETAHRDGLLDQGWDAVLAVLELVKLLQPASDRDKAVLVDDSEVSGMKDSRHAVGQERNDLVSCLLVIVVSTHDIRPAAADLSFDSLGQRIAFTVEYIHVDARHGQSDATRSSLRENRQSDDGRCFGQTVTLAQRDPDAVHEFDDFRWCLSACTKRSSEVSAKLRSYLG